MKHHPAPLRFDRGLLKAAALTLTLTLAFSFALLALATH